MKNTVFLYLSQLRIFWWLRTWFLRIVFWIEAQIFGVKYNLQEERSNYQSIRHLFAITQKQLILAIGFAILLQYVDPYLHIYYQAMGLKVPEDGDYVTLLAAISGIGGVFIGLYYAGISTIGGAIYARVPNNVRDLLAQERFGNVYMRSLSFLTFLCLALIALRVCGYPRVMIAIPFTTIAAGIGIIAFVKLGQRVFYLFDPTKLSYHVFEQMEHWLRMAKAGGFRWHDKSFQHHAHKQASSILDTLETLADITARESHLNGRPFVELTKNLIRFLSYYEGSKRYIPSQSGWYAQRYEHRDWYRTEDSRVAIAHQTGTALHPDITNDKEWVEGRVISILKQCFSVNLAESRYTEILGLFDYMDAYLRKLASEGQVEAAFARLSEVSAVILGQLASQSGEELVRDEVLEKVAIAERLAALPISIAIAYREQTEQLDSDRILLQLSRIQWENDASIYRQSFAAYCLPRLEWFRLRLTFERSVEGLNVSPLWYQAELLRQVEAEQFVSNANTLTSKGISYYSSLISKTVSAKHPWLSAAIMSREWEYWHKVDDQLEHFPKKWNDLGNDRCIDGLPWPTFDNDKLRSECTGRRDELLRLMSRQNMLMALLARPAGFPDYAGQFLHTSGEVVFDALLGNNTEMLRGVFEAYLYGCLLRFDSLRPKTPSTDWRSQQDFKIAAAALLDVMDVSGYARLMADYHENEELWTIVTSAWNKYLAQGHAQSPLPLFAAAIGITEMAFEVPHRGVLRTSWHRKINQRLSDVPRKEVHLRRSFSSDTVIEHKSALVRIFAQEPFGGSHNGIDIFVGFYLSKSEKAVGLEFGLKRRNLMEQVKRQEDKYGTEGRHGRRK